MLRREQDQSVESEKPKRRPPRSKRRLWDQVAAHTSHVDISLEVTADKRWRKLVGAADSQLGYTYEETGSIHWLITQTSYTDQYKILNTSQLGWWLHNTFNYSYDIFVLLMIWANHRMYVCKQLKVTWFCKQNKNKINKFQYKTLNSFTLF